MRILFVLPALAAIAAACGPSSPPASPAPEPAPTASASTTSAPAAATSPAPDTNSAHKRTRTARANPQRPDGTKPKNGRTLNPKDANGRTVFVREDDHCFVEVPPPSRPPEAAGPRAAATKEMPPPGAPIERATEVVDCPPAADDPAYDHCAAQIVLDESGSKCFCVTGAGHPRPMPRPTPCPSSR